MSAVPAALRPNGHRVFFPLALLVALAAVPYWAAGYLGLFPIPWSPAMHAHEMVMGYAAAVVGGFLLVRPSRAALAMAVGAWLLGRAAVLVPAPAILAIPAALAYPIVLFVLGGWPFLRAGKSSHNAVFGPLIAALVAAEALYRLGGDGGQAGSLFALHVIGLLLFTMGGRVIPAATAGEIRKQGGLLVERVQRRLEWLGIAGGTVATLSSATGLVPEAGAAGAAVIGLAALARLSRWRTMAVLGRSDLWGLHLGYAWLGLGWILAGVERLAPLPAGAGWHLLGVGALGTIAGVMMLRVTVQREAAPPSPPPVLVWAIGLIGLAAVLRVTAAFGAPVAQLALAALAWTAGHAVLLAALLRIPRRS